MTRFARFSLVVAAVLFVPAMALAQLGGASIAGVVKDTSGAVLPGVTVEAASPALIEKTRTATTDGRGRYEIVGLRPGDYTLTFTLPGFSTVRRENLTLMGEFTATIDADMKVGAIEETVTVSGESPIIDITNAKRERVMTSEVIESLPSSRIHSSLAQLVPGIQTANQDVGGTIVAAGLMSGHGSHGPDSRIMVNGVSQGSARNSGGGVTTPDIGAFQEYTIDYAGGLAEATTGGIQVNLVPKEGGNALKGSSYVSFASPRWQSNNLTHDLEARGLDARDRIRDNSDINPGFGGPITRDKLWFFFTFRNQTSNNYIGGLYINKNAGNPKAWTFDPDLTRQAFDRHNWKDTQLRLTWQISPRNKLATTIEEMKQCECPSGPSATTAVEAAGWSVDGQKHQYYLDYSLPLTNRILIEASSFYREDDWKTGNFDGTRNPLINPVQIQSTGFRYRAQTAYNDSHHVGFYYRGSLSYVTGTHNIKVGFNNDPAWLIRGMNAVNPLFYRFDKPIEEGGVPNQLTLNATPFYPRIDIRRSLGIFAQDKWTTNRLTIGVGLRFDNFVGGYRAQHFGPAPLVPNRNLDFAPGEANNWKDITPRSSLTYDLFGNGKTALKVTLNKYMGAASTQGLDGTLNPFNTLVNSTARSWTDANRNYIPDCDILNPARQDNRAAGGDLCGAMADSAFGTSRVGVTVDPRLQNGWGVRDYSWEFSTGVQHELLRGLVLDVGYFRRWYGNFTVTDNRALSPEDFDRFSLTAPKDTPFATTAPAGTGLPNGGGYVISGLYDLKPASFGRPADNYITLSDNYGKQIEHWNGVDVSAIARLPFGLRVQGGTSTGRWVFDSCEIRAKLPEMSVIVGSVAVIGPTSPFCHATTGFLTDVSGYATYTVPKIDVLTSVTFQNRPSRANGVVNGGGGNTVSLTYNLQANYRADNAILARQSTLGRPLSGTTANITVPLIEPYSILGDRFTQVDLRFGKILKVGRTRSVLNLDIYNALNSSSILIENSSFDVWRRPEEILLARFFKVGLQFDF
jgi:hypothetical protein